MTDMTYRAPAKKRIVFLDIDGPFNTLRALVAGMKYDPISVKVINDFLQMPNTFAVISSVERKLRSSPEEMGKRLREKYDLKIPVFHQNWRTGTSCLLRQDEIQAWLDENGMDEDTDYIAVDDDPVNIEGVYHVRANYNGIMADQLLLLKLLKGECRWREYNDWAESAIKRARTDAEREPVLLRPESPQSA